MRLCLTGGAGFLGQVLAHDLIAGGAEVIAIDSLNTQVHLDPEASRSRFPGSLIVGDIRDAVAVAKAVGGCQVVVHLAAETGVGQSMAHSDHYRSVNVKGTQIVAEEAYAAGCSFILVSSRAVYGQGAYRCTEHGRVDTGRCCHLGQPDSSLETDNLRPLSVYGTSKVDAERAVHSVYPANDGRVVVVRPQNVIGPGQAPHNPYTGVLAAFAARLSAGLPPQIYGSGEQTRDFIDVRDVSRVLTWAVASLVQRQFSDNQTFNVGSGQRTSLLQLAQVAVECSGMTPGDLQHVDVTRPGDIDHACADITRLREAGAPMPTVSLAVSVAEFLRFAATTGPVDPSLWDDALSELDPANTDPAP